MKKDIALPQKKTRSSEVSPRGAVDKNWQKLLYAGTGLAALGLVFGFIPGLNSYGVWIAIIALAIGLFGFLKKLGKNTKVLLALSLLALVVSLVSVAIQNNSEWSATNDILARKDGSLTQQLLKTDLEVTFGDYSDDGLTVTIKNKNPEKKFYGLTVEAKANDGWVIEKQTVDVGEILPDGQKEITIFEDVSDEQRTELEAAKFEVTFVSQY